MTASQTFIDNFNSAALRFGVTATARAEVTNLDPEFTGDTVITFGEWTFYGRTEGLTDAPFLFVQPHEDADQWCYEGPQRDDYIGNYSTLRDTDFKSGARVSAQVLQMVLATVAWEVRRLSA